MGVLLSADANVSSSFLWSPHLRPYPLFYLSGVPPCFARVPSSGAFALSSHVCNVWWFEVCLDLFLPPMPLVCSFSLFVSGGLSVWRWIGHSTGCAEALDGEGGAHSDGSQARPGEGPLASPSGDDVLLWRAIQVGYRIGPTCLALAANPGATMTSRRHFSCGC